MNKKLTKIFFKRNFDLILSEKKLIDDATFIVQMDWMASLKPEQINVNAFKDEQQIFEEVQVISIKVNEVGLNKQSKKLTELVQKFIPYHLLLCVYNDEEMILNTAFKSVNQNDSSRRVVNTVQNTGVIKYREPDKHQQAFFAALAFEKLLKDDLKTLYESYAASIAALNTAAVTDFFITRNGDRSKADAESLMTINLLESEIITLQNQAKKESQVSIQIKLNEEVQYRRKEIEKLKQKLQA